MNCSIAVYKLHWKFCIIIWLEYPLFHSYWSSFINLYLQKYIPFHRNRKNIPKIQMESQETLNSQNNLEKEMETSHFLTSKWKSLSHVRLFVAHGILQGSRILEWVAFPFSKGSSQPRGQTRVSHTAGGFCTSWALQRGLFYQMSGGTSTWVGQI